MRFPECRAGFIRSWNRNSSPTTLSPTSSLELLLPCLLLLSCPPTPAGAAPALSSLAFHLADSVPGLHSWPRCFEASVSLTSHPILLAYRNPDTRAAHTSWDLLCVAADSFNFFLWLESLCGIHFKRREV